MICDLVDCVVVVVGDVRRRGVRLIIQFSAVVVVESKCIIGKREQSRAATEKGVYIICAIFYRSSRYIHIGVGEIHSSGPSLWSPKLQNTPNKKTTTCPYPVSI